MWSLAFYGSETWTTKKQEWHRIEAFKMWCYKKMFKFKWADKVKMKVYEGASQRREKLLAKSSLKKSWTGRTCID